MSSLHLFLYGTVQGCGRKDLSMRGLGAGGIGGTEVTGLGQSGGNVESRDEGGADTACSGRWRMTCSGRWRERVDHMGRVRGRGGGPTTQPVSFLLCTSLGFREK